MRFLPVKDNEWVAKNATFEYHSYGIYAYFPNFIIIDFYGKYNDLDLKNYYIFQDTTTKEFFKSRKSDWVYRAENIDIYTKFIRRESDYKFSSEFNKSDIAKEFCISRNINIDLTENACCNYLYKYMRSFTRLPSSFIEGNYINIASIIQDQLNNDDYFDEDMLNELVKSRYRECYEKLFKSFDDHIDLIKVKAILVSHDTMFSGNFKINFSRYNDNPKIDTFDIITIEINMLSDYKQNLDFLRNNINKTKIVLKNIVKSHSKSKIYANFMKLDKLTLRRDCVLEARFVFREDVEKLLSEREVV